MPDKVIRIDVFISSPGDMLEERQIIRRVIEKLNRGVLRDSYFLVPVLYEEEMPPQIGRDARLLLDRLRHVQNSYILVGMFWSRMGTPFEIVETAETYESGPQYEILMAHEHYGRNGQPHILLYKKEQDNPGADPVQKEKVERFFNGFFGDPPEVKGLFEKYSHTEEFEAKIEAHLAKLIQFNPLQMDKVQFMEPPAFKEEPRRIDAAMPRQTAVGEPAAVQVMLCLPDSKGLQAFLSQDGEGNLETQKRNVRAGGLTIAFPVNKATGRAEPASISVDVQANDFRVVKNSIDVQLVPGQDSGQITFDLIPVCARRYSTVVVRVKCTTLDGSVLECGTVVLYTVVKTTKSQMSSQVVWDVVSRRLGTSSAFHRVAQADPEALHEKRILRKKALIILSRCPVYSTVASGQDGFMLAETSQIGSIEVTGRVLIDGRSFAVYPLALDRRIDLSENVRSGWIKVEGKSMNASLPIVIEAGDYLLFCSGQAAFNDIVLADIDETGRGSNVVVMRYRKGQLLCESTENHSPISITGLTKILGRVVAVAKLDHEASKALQQDGAQDKGLF